MTLLHVTGSIAIPVSVQNHLHTIRCPGVEVKEIFPTVVQIKTQTERLAFQKHEFSPFFEFGSVKTFREGLWEVMDLAIENSHSVHFEAMDIFLHKENSVASIVNEVFKYMPKIKVLHTCNYASSIFIAPSFLKLYFTATMGQEFISNFRQFSSR